MTAYFKKRNIDNPRLNAEHLLAHVLERTRMELYLEFERNLGETELATLRELATTASQRRAFKRSRRAVKGRLPM